ncbi:MAG: cysteine-rich CWC family protein [Gammaproteobacteria bacterium]|nr:cysteine-rich CWC family protein [Gammaproteobacteria bacterium]
MDDPATPPAGASRCAACGAPFHCGRDDAEPCWCARDYPPLLPLPGSDTALGCLCPACLERALALRAPPG